VWASPVWRIGRAGPLASLYGVADCTACERLRFLPAVTANERQRRGTCGGLPTRRSRTTWSGVPAILFRNRHGAVARSPLLAFLGSVTVLAELTAPAEVFDVLAARLAGLARGS